MKIADLYASLSLKPDATWGKGEKQIKDFKSKLDKWIERTNASLGRRLNVTALAGAGAFGFLTKGALDFDEALTTLGISAQGAMGTTEAMRKSFIALSNATGIAREELVAGAQAYVAATGDGKGATAAVAAFARVARASATPIDEVAKAAAAINEQFGIMPADMEKAFSILIAGGKVGKIELNNMADLTAQLGAAFKEFSGSQGLDGVAQLGALFQLAAKDAGDASQAANNLINLMNNIKNREFDLKGIGVNVRGQDGKLKDIVQIVEMLTKAKAKNGEAFLEAFGRDAQARAGLNAIATRINQTKELIAATRNANDVATDGAKRNASTSEKARKAINELKNTMMELAARFLPAVTSALQKIASGVSSFVNAVGGAERAVMLLVSAWTALKALNLTVFLTQLAAKLAAVSASSSGLLAGVSGAAGVASKVGGVLAAGAGGYAVGTALDSAFGLSDKIAAGLSGYDNGDFIDPVYRQHKYNMAKRDVLSGTSDERVQKVINLNITAANTEAKKLAKEVFQELTAAEKRAFAAGMGAP